MLIDAWWLFPLGVLFDFLYILWYWAAEKERAWLGGCASVAIVGVGMTGLLQAVDNHWNMVPYMAGLFLGSVLGIKFKSYWNKRNVQRRDSVQP